jgi:hypothetical protein
MKSSQFYKLMKMAGSGNSDTFSQNFSNNSSLSNWIIPGSAQVLNGSLVITPTAGSELLADPGLEAAYTAGLCGSLTKNGTPTIAESADVHGGSKAQVFTATANGDYVRYVYGSASIAGRWYLASMWAKRTAGTAGTLAARLLHGNGTGATSNRRFITPATYTQLSLAMRAVSTNNMAVHAWQIGATPFDTGIVDDFSLKLLTTSTLGIYRPANSATYQVGIVPASANQGQPYGVWLCVDNPANPLNGILAWYDNMSVYLDKYVNGAVTNLITTSRQFYDSNTVEGVRNGNDYSLYFSGSQSGATQTAITDIGNCPYVGVFATTPEVTIARFDKRPLSYAVNIWGFGDSKILATNGPIGKLGTGVREVPIRVGVSGKTVAEMKARVDADLAAASGTPNFVFINLGTNDFGSDSATWKTNYAYILDAIHTKWTNARIAVTVPWKTGEDANADIRATDLGVVLATRSWAGIAVDERTVIKPYADRLSADNVHPNTLGYYYEAVAIRSWMEIP